MRSQKIPYIIVVFNPVWMAGTLYLKAIERYLAAVLYTPLSSQNAQKAQDI